MTPISQHKNSKQLDIIQKKKTLTVIINLIRQLHHKFLLIKYSITTSYRNVSGNATWRQTINKTKRISVCKVNPKTWMRIYASLPPAWLLCQNHLLNCSVWKDKLNYTATGNDVIYQTALVQINTRGNEVIYQIAIV